MTAPRLVQPSARFWTEFAFLKPYTVREVHDLLAVIAGLLPADEDEQAERQAAELRQRAEALGRHFTISGGEVLELGPQEGTDADIPY